MPSAALSHVQTRVPREADPDDREKKTMSQDATSDASDVASALTAETGGTSETDQPLAQAARVSEQQPDSGDSSTNPSNDEDRLGESGKRALASERQARRDAEKRLGELKTRLQEFEDRDKSDLQKATERAQSYEQQVTAMRETNARLLAAATYSIPPELIDLLGSGSDEEIATRAELLAERLKAVTPPPAAASQRPVESLTPGAAPSSASPASADDWIRRMAGRNP